MRTFKLALLISLLLFMRGAGAFVLSIDGLAVHLVGEISVKDVVELKKHVGRSPVRKIVLYANSRGGDWEAAMDLGRALRASQSAVMVVNDSICMSACVLVLAGATTRIVDESAKVGIHRPYSQSTKPLTFDEAQVRYRLLETKTKQYLKAMNMPDSLWDALVATPPEKVRFLSLTELEAFRLTGKDPALQEVEDAENARKQGLTKEVYFVRKNQVWPKCGSLFPTQEEIDRPGDALALRKLTAYGACELAVLRGER